MSKRPSALERAIQNLDEQIAALQLAKQHLVMQRPSPDPKPKAVPKRQQPEKAG